jgi:5'-nucleotidase
VDVIVGGHTHAAIAHRVAGVAIVQSWSKGEGFGRVDLVIDGQTHKVKSAHIFPPHKLAPGEVYEGQTVVPDPKVAATFADDARRAEEERVRPLGPTLDEKLWSSYDEESPLGNLIADLLREAAPGADFALQNGGGLRAPLAQGKLLYGQVYEVVPFDNRLAIVTMRGSTLRALLRDNYGASHGGFLSIAGLSAHAHCSEEGLVLELRASDGRLVEDSREYRVAMADFLAQGGDAFGKIVLPAPGTKVDILWDRPAIHDIIAELLGKHPPVLRMASFFDKSHPRALLPGIRPVCKPERAR